MINFIMKNILLSNRNILPVDERYRILIMTNISFIVIILASLIFAIINTINEAFLVVFIEISSILLSSLGLYLLRKSYDIYKFATSSSILIFIILLSILFIRTGIENTLLWSLLFAPAVMILKGAKEGLYYSILFYLINFVFLYNYIGDTVTMAGYIRFISVAIIIVVMAYFYEITMKNTFEILKESMIEIKHFNINLESKIVETIENSNKLKERLELALAGNNDGVWDVNFSTNEVYYSPRWKEMIGYSDDELANEHITWESRVHPEDLEKIYKDHQENIKTTGFYNTTHRLKHKNGSWVWILSRAKTIFDEDGKAIRMIGTHTDISERKKIEQELLDKKIEAEERNKNLNYLLDTTMEAIVISDKDTNIILVNQACAILFKEKDKLALLGKSITEYVPEYEIRKLQKSLEKAYDEPREYNLKKSDGTIFSALASGRNILMNREDVRVSTILDLTQIKRAEESLKEQHKYLQSIIDGVDDPIMVIKEDYTVEVMNNSLKKSLKNLNIADPDYPKCYEISHHRSTPCDGFSHPCPLRDVLETKEHVSVIHNHNTEDGDNRYIELSASPLFDKEKNCIGIIESARDITGHLEIQSELRDQKNILHFQAHHDALTGLPNRVLFNDRLEQAIETAKRNKTNIALLFIDLDHFKEINDSLGHAVGDEILITVASRLNEVIRKEDTIARLGGDEFTIVLENLTQPQDASPIANKILQSFSKVINIEDNPLYITTSIGISIYPNDGGSAQNLLKYADSAMYKAKDEGRNNFQFYSAEMTELAFERVVMEASLRMALENEEFVVYYQPQVNGVTDKLIGMEALVRWQHPTMGLLSPAKFIPLAEVTGLIIELDRFVMRTAMTQLSQWYKDGLNPGVLAMNLAVKQLKQKDFISIFEELMKETECKAEWIELEITENQIMTNPEEAIKILKQISDLGVELAIDDFGTGYSSLAYLKKLPIDKLKIDQAFVRDLPQDEEDAAITKAVIALARSLNLRVIAEGVETKEQRDFIVENGCENIQGYYYSKPIPADEMEVVLKKGFDT